jgi:hypothetical protein
MIGLALGHEHRSYKGPYAETPAPHAHKPVRSQGELGMKFAALTALGVIAAAVLAAPLV